MMEVVQYNQPGSWLPSSLADPPGNAVLKDTGGLCCWQVGHRHEISFGNIVVRILQSNRTRRISIEEEIYYKKLIMQLWRLRSPTVCHLQARDSGKRIMFININNSNPLPGAKKTAGDSCASSVIR